MAGWSRWSLFVQNLLRIRCSILESRIPERVCWSLRTRSCAKWNYSVYFKSFRIPRWFSTKMCRLTNEGWSGQVETNIRELLLLYRYFWRSVVLLVDTFAHIRVIRSARTVLQWAYIPDWTKIYPGSVTQNWKHFTRDGGPWRHVSRIRSNKLHGIGNRRRARSRAKSRTRAPQLVRFYFLCSHVRRVCTRLPTILLRSAPFCSAGRVDPH